MINNMEDFLRAWQMVSPGDRVICGLSGGADSVAMTFGLWLLKEKLGITLEAAHFNHHLRGEESDRDAAFVQDFCERYEIPLHLGEAQVTAGPKGLEAAAREARYAFFRSLNGKIATAHTADDNAETVIMHLVRGTGLRGLGGITPVTSSLIRPMLGVTRQQVEQFLREFALPHVEDSSNGSRDFLRNRIRQGVMPLLREENPRIGENLSRMALRLREDEAFIENQMPEDPGVSDLRAMEPALRTRCLERFLKENRVPEPEDSHIALLESLVFSGKPSARASFPGGVEIGRNYDRLRVLDPGGTPGEQLLPCPGEILWEPLGLRVLCRPAEKPSKTYDCFTVVTRGPILVGPRREGDRLRLSGGSKSLKKLWIDRKVPAAQRLQIPVLRDDLGVLGVYGMGADLDRLAEELPAVEIRFESVCKMK